MVTRKNEGSCRTQVIVKRWRPARSIFFAASTLLMLALFAISSSIALAQEDDARAVKTRKIGIHSSGTITIAETACPTGTPIGDDCYAISGTLKQGTKTGAASGTIITSGTPTTTKNGSCYTLINTSTQSIVVEGYTLTGSLTGEACIKTTKKGISTEQLVGGAWQTTGGSPVSGKGKETFRGTPTDPTSTTSPLAGSGIAHLSGTVEVVL